MQKVTPRCRIKDEKFTKTLEDEFIYHALKNHQCLAEVVKRAAEANETLNFQHIDTISKSGKINESQYKNKSAIHYITSRVSDVKVFDLLIKNGVKFDNLDNSGITPLHEIAIHGNIKALDILISRGISVFSKETCGKFLNFAVANKHYNMVENIINYAKKFNIPNEAFINFKDYNGNTLLQQSIINREVKLFKILYNNQADYSNIKHEQLNYTAKDLVDKLDINNSSELVMKYSVSKIVEKEEPLSLNTVELEQRACKAAFDNDTKTLKITLELGASIYTKCNFYSYCNNSKFPSPSKPELIPLAQVANCGEALEIQSYLQGIYNCVLDKLTDDINLSEIYQVCTPSTDFF